MTIPLGKNTPQPITYSPQSLSPIPRSIGRKILPKNILKQMRGYDIWTCWECSWLGNNGVPQQAVVQMLIQANSPNIVESKSLKLYLNSLNNHHVGEQKDLLQLLEEDLSPILESKPIFKILKETAQQRKALAGECIDNYSQQLSAIYTYDERLETLKKNNDQTTAQYTAHSQLFRSLCPVTAQPDFASVYVHNTHINPQALLSYWLSFRNHQGFHEQCIEQMFCDFLTYSQATNNEVINLKTGGSFTRRGGIDIHPIRYHQDAQRINEVF